MNTYRFMGLYRIFFNISLLIIILILSDCTSKLDSELENTIKKDQPNIILVVSDDHGKDALGCYGNPVIQTPHLDQLAKEGVKFNKAFCTAATCSASRSAILTGKFGHATGHYGHAHSYHHFSTYDTITSLPVYLEQLGYHTARIGKYHLAPESVYRFNEVIPANDRSTIKMAEDCKDVFNQEKPFFLYFCTGDPHRGKPTDPSSWSAPNSFGNKTEPYPGETMVKYSPEDVIVPDFLPDTKECREELAQYYQSVSRIDQGFGRLMDLLSESGKENETVIIYISDNGIAFPGAKTTTYNPGIELPCIIKAPGLEKVNIENSAMISWVDLTPTILDFANADLSNMYFHGKSFKNIIDRPEATGWDEIYASHIFHEVTMYYPMRVYHNRNYKLIWNIAWRLEYPFATDLWASSTWQSIYRNKIENYGPRTVQDYLFRPEFELYDIKKDPLETNNLAENPEFKLILDDMLTKIKKFQMNTKDPWIIMWEQENVFGGDGLNL